MADPFQKELLQIACSIQNYIYQITTVLVQLTNFITENYATYNQFDCVPCSTESGESTNVSQAITSTGATKILGINPNRLGFIVNNIPNSMAVYVSNQPQNTTAAAASVLVPAGKTAVVNAYTLPASLTGEIYARAASGSPTIQIVEQKKVQ